jgi:hypothetical protein
MVDKCSLIGHIKQKEHYMTNFEKSIKREMTREKFEEIRDHVYGDGKNTFKYTYGDVSSWFTWNRDENGKILEVEPPIHKWTERGHKYDGPIENWDGEKVPAERRVSSRITTDIVFIGLNMSGDGGRSGFPVLFQNARGHRRIVETFFNTAAEGAYFTDIIKPDRRFLDNIGNPANAKEVLQIVKSQPEILKEHIRLLKEELAFIGAKNPLLIVFGNDANWILEQGFQYNILRKNQFHAIVKILAYSAYPKGGDEGFKNDTKEKLKEYITIK